jgi:peptidoglycan/xylan/chitin deacetylase (PgdA/CDA1 family)
LILLYHRIFPDSTSKSQWYSGPVLRFSDFKNQINWLQKHFNIVPLAEIVRMRKAGKRDHGKMIALTFDDGFQSYYDFLIPYLEENKIPATFFITTGHLLNGELAWFSYLNALCFERIFEKIALDGQEYDLASEKASRATWKTLLSHIKRSKSPHTFLSEFSKKYPIPSEIKNNYLGFSKDQIAFIGRSKVLEVGGHTVFHPFLNTASDQLQIFEINENKRMLEDCINSKVRFFAYPSGAYDTTTIRFLKEAGFEAAFAVNPKNHSDDKNFEFERTGVYSKSILKVRVKTSPITRFFRKNGLNFE